MTEQTILDMCCGSRMFWFNKRDTRAVFADIRAEEHKLCDGRRLVISPDLAASGVAYKERLNMSVVAEEVAIIR